MSETPVPRDPGETTTCPGARRTRWLPLARVPGVAAGAGEPGLAALHGWCARPGSRRPWWVWGPWQRPPPGLDDAQLVVLLAEARAGAATQRRRSPRPASAAY